VGSLASVCILRGVFEYLVNSRAVTIPRRNRRRHCSSTIACCRPVLMSEFTLCYPHGLLFLCPSCTWILFSQATSANRISGSGQPRAASRPRCGHPCYKNTNTRCTKKYCLEVRGCTLAEDVKYCSILLTFVFLCIVKCILQLITNRVQLLWFIYFYSALHVSGDVSAHHQEHITVTTASGIGHRCCCWLGLRIGWKMTFTSVPQWYAPYDGRKHRPKHVELIRNK